MKSREIHWNPIRFRCFVSFHGCKNDVLILNSHSRSFSAAIIPCNCRDFHRPPQSRPDFKLIFAVWWIENPFLSATNVGLVTHWAPAAQRLQQRSRLKILPTLSRLWEEWSLVHSHTVNCPEYVEKMINFAVYFRQQAGFHQCNFLISTLKNNSNGVLGSRLWTHPTCTSECLHTYRLTTLSAPSDRPGVWQEHIVVQLCAGAP